MAILFALRLALSLPFFALANGLDLLAHWIAGIRRVISVEINAHPTLGYGVISSNLAVAGRWHDEIGSADTASRFVISQAVERESDRIHRAETSVPHETE